MTRLKEKITFLTFFTCLITGCGQDVNAPVVFQDDCITGYTGTSLDVVTWNLHDFPANGDITVDSLALLITRLDADIIAMQEITSPGGFNKLLSELPRYRGIINANSDLNLAYLFKENILTEPGGIRVLFEEDPYIFPRPPLCLTLSGPGNRDMVFINIHLKCCEGTENVYRRNVAMDKLKDYLDDSLKNRNVIILGDFNSSLTGDENENPFSGFMADSLHYRFADWPVALGDESNWSYPGWPSHIDHFIITDELFNENISVLCLTPDLCDSLYFVNISDHRPLLMQIRTSVPSP